MKALIGFRHGKTSANMITQEGKNLLRVAARYVNEIFPNASSIIISSPEDRAYQSAMCLKDRLDNCNKIIQNNQMQYAFEFQTDFEEMILEEVEEAIKKIGQECDIVIFVGHGLGQVEFCNHFCKIHSLPTFSEEPQPGKANIINFETNETFEQVPHS